MSRAEKKLININRNEFVDRRIDENVKFPELTISVDTIDTVLLLLQSGEEEVLINALKHIMEYVRRNDESISLLKEKNVLWCLLQKEFYRGNPSVLVRRLCLYLASFVIENINCLVELETAQLHSIVNLGLSYYVEEDDDFCCEYLSVILNKCLADPQCVDMLLKNMPFVLKYFSTIATSTNPDVVWNSFELLHKVLLVQSGEEKLDFIGLNSFPVKRLLCELKCEYFEIRKAALKVLQSLLVDPKASRVLNENSSMAFLVEQLTNMFSESLLAEELSLIVEVLSTALEHDSVVSTFFEQNLFEKYVNRINEDAVAPEITCKALQIFAECGKSGKFLPRLVAADVTEKLLECLLNGDDNPAGHILLALNRLMKSSVAAKIIVDSYDRGLLNKILKVLPPKETNIKAREQAANLLENLISYAFHKTADAILDLNFLNILANIFTQNPSERSIDLILSLLNVIETMAANTDYRVKVCENKEMISNMAILLKNSFSNAILVTHLLRCLCCLVNELEVHEVLLKCVICSSIKRALKSASNQVKTAATNFIMQTTRFSKFALAYKESGVLDVLLLNQNYGFCVPTWQPAIESILSKNLTLKFCIRHSLSFTDITVGGDFMVSKRKFEDYRVFQCILKDEVSPLHPVIVVNFNRTEAPENLVVRVTPSYYDRLERGSLEEEWCYCRSPGDAFLPNYLVELNDLLRQQNLTTNSAKKQPGIGFDNLAKRAKVIAQVVERALCNDLQLLDLHSTEECSEQAVKSHLRDLCMELHCSFIPLGRIRTGCKFERAILFKVLADQVGLPCTLQRSVDGRVLFNELPLPVESDRDVHCGKKTLDFMPWRMLRPTHIIDLMYNVGELYPLQSRQTLQYLRLY